ncbi:hypothetical protein NAT02_18550 [Aeromonas hydrophila]|uniref:hypothetical protein n=1 Tax=Aeromonas hydrophila TaxID=644 RepID=UPI001A222ABB|nr:hypothetical protein [Aeromonas hydrophila]MCP3244850.1 hypothetical protein [Aeromonas hydrophila]HAU4897204.1 hypothetical protein [Aeromonas hydrophila]
MESMTIIPAVFSLIGVGLALYAMFRSSSNLTTRLKIERKLAYNLAQELKSRNIESDISVKLDKIIVRSKVEEEDIENLKLQIDDALKSALKALVESEQELIRNSLEQPSKQGQTHYLKKVINNSLQELKHQKA